MQKKKKSKPKSQNNLKEKKKKDKQKEHGRCGRTRNRGLAMCIRTEKLIKEQLKTHVHNRSNEVTVMAVGKWSPVWSFCEATMHAGKLTSSATI